MGWKLSCWAGGTLLMCWSNNAIADKQRTNSTTDCSAMLHEQTAPRSVVVMLAASCFMDQRRYASAAKLLQNRLEEMESQGQDGGRAAVENKLQTVLGEVATFDIRTETNAEIVVDGAVVGRYPEVNPLFLEPGAHEIITRSGERQTSFKVDAVAGSVSPLELKLATAAKPPGIVPMDSPRKTSAPLVKPRESTKWTGPRIATIAIAGSLGITGLVLGIGFTSAAHRDETRRSEIVENFPLRTQQCSALPNLPDCKAIADLVQQRDQSQRIGAVGFVATGATIATIIAAMVWPAKTNPQDERRGSKAMFIVPRSNGAEFRFVGSF